MSLPSGDLSRDHPELTSFFHAIVKELSADYLYTPTATAEGRTRPDAFPLAIKAIPYMLKLFVERFPEALAEDRFNPRKKEWSVFFASDGAE